MAKCVNYNMKTMSWKAVARNEAIERNDNEMKYVSLLEEKSRNNVWKAYSRNYSVGRHHSLFCDLFSPLPGTLVACWRTLAIPVSSRCRYRASFRPQGAAIFWSAHSGLDYGVLESLWEHGAGWVQCPADSHFALGSILTCLPVL